MGLQFTYTTLTQAILQYTLEGTSLTTGDFASFLPTIIQIAEERIVRDLNLNVFDVEQHGNLSANNPFLAIPNNYLGIRSFSIAPNGFSVKPLQRHDITWLENYWRNSASVGTPAYYAVWGNDGSGYTSGSFKLAPTPDFSYPYTLRFIQRPESISATNPQTWLGDHAADCLLFACLAESMGYLREDVESEAGMTQMFEKKYQATLDKLKKELSNQTITGLYY